LDFICDENHRRQHSLPAGIPQAVLDTARSALHFSGDLFCGTFGLHFGVSGHFSDRFLYGTLGLMGSTFDTIFVHDCSPIVQIKHDLRRSGSLIVGPDVSPA
jgi:hypothetical protein